ncbi:MAG TPA: phospho-N-acetylmuramoyl-pentapeptide-transferase [Firmicutes bacterium]|jgi:phospho-N-acetylmuramoyl-pentapeptide-transferase|nr:phospho-N-acetylmuramoyl-pentapeptide-transferase [Bacillota bacterium]
MTLLLKLLFAALVSFIIALVFGPFTIKMLHRFKFGQSIRSDGPQSHLKKAGTPTMGGILILFSLVIGLLIVRASSPVILWLLFLTLSFGLIGLLDDMIIIITKKSLGLTARQKLLGQILFASLAVLFMIHYQLPTAQQIPFTNLKLTFPAGGFGNPIFFLYAVFVIVAFSNAVNLTDGLDGLAGGTTAIAALFLGVLALFQRQPQLAVFAFALAGACIGFVWFNGPPAQVFMGDTGSLALGAALAGIAIFSQMSLFFVIIGGIFVAEVLSVTIQVTSFKTTGKRVFRMSPLHHHFELGGMVEPKIMIRFWIIGIVLGVIGILGYLVR